MSPSHIPNQDNFVSTSIFPLVLGPLVSVCFYPLVHFLFFQKKTFFSVTFPIIQKKFQKKKQKKNIVKVGIVLYFFACSQLSQKKNHEFVCICGKKKKHFYASFENMLQKKKKNKKEDKKSEILNVWNICMTTRNFT